VYKLITSRIDVIRFFHIVPLIGGLVLKVFALDVFEMPVYAVPALNTCLL